MGEQVTREELDRRNADAVTRHSRALGDDPRNPPQQLLDELRAFAEQYRLEWAEQYYGEQVPAEPSWADLSHCRFEVGGVIHEAADVRILRPAVTVSVDTADADGMAEVGPETMKPPAAPASKPAPKTTTPRRPAARRKAT